MDNQDDPDILLRDDNIVSLRTAIVHDDGNLVSLSLLHPPGSSIPRSTPTSRKAILESEPEFTWLYRHLRSPSEEKRLMNVWPGVVEQDIKPILVKTTPKLTFLWSDSGHSVALLLNEDPWAFIDEETHQTYSKGMLKSLETGKLWDQKRFEAIFGQMLG